MAASMTATLLLWSVLVGVGLATPTFVFGRRAAGLVAAAVVTYVAAMFALGPFHPLLRLACGVVALLLPAAGMWWSLGHFGPHACYYARDAAGAVIYVGQMSRRASSYGDADITERLREHLADDGKPWKRDIVVGNCTVARRCWTRWGLSLSERRRITALSAAARQGACGKLHNTLLVPGENDGRHTLTMWWYSLESHLAIDDGAAWHRPVRYVTAPTATSSSDDDDADGDADDDAYPDDDAPIVVTATYERSQPGGPWPTVLALGPVPGGRGHRDDRRKGPKGPCDGGTGGRVPWGTGAEGDSVEPGPDGVRGSQGVVNGDSGASQAGGATSAADAAERRREREREKKRRQRARRRQQGDGEAA